MRSFLSAQRPGLKSSLDWKWITHDSFAALPSVLPDLSCPHCPETAPAIRSVRLVGQRPASN